MVLTTLHSGGKYGQGGYKFSGGTHGVGAKCVNAVSEWFEVEVSRDGKVHHMEFERGKTIQEARSHRQGQGHRHAHHFQAGPGNFPGDDRVQGGHHRPALARAGVFEFRPGNHLHRRAPDRQPSRNAFTTRTASRNSSSSSTRTRSRCIPSRSHSARRRRRSSTTRRSKSTSRSCCNTTTATTTRCSATPTRSTIPTAARISPAFAAR